MDLSNSVNLTSFTFLLNACLAIYIWSGKGVLKKIILSALVFLISISGEQISGILMAIACIFIPTYFLIFKISFLSIFFYFLLSIAGSLVVNINILEIASSLSLNPRNFEIAQKLLSYIALWTKPFEGITFLKSSLVGALDFQLQFLPIMKFLMNLV